jgi:hypothetical protein
MIQIGVFHRIDEIHQENEVKRSLTNYLRRHLHHQQFEMELEQHHFDHNRMLMFDHIDKQQVAVMWKKSRVY